MLLMRNRETRTESGEIMKTNGKKVVLYIEDDPDYREAIRAMVEAGGYVVVEAMTAEEGLLRYKETKPDLVIVDLMMEEVDAGVGFVKEIRALRQDVPVFLLSSVGESLLMNKDYRDLGLSSVLQKPVSSETLLSMIRSRL